MRTSIVRTLAALVAGCGPVEKTLGGGERGREAFRHDLMAWIHAHPPEAGLSPAPTGP
jgi:hypothetical protein